MKRTLLRWLVFTVMIGLIGGCGTSDQPTFQGSDVPWTELLAFAEQEAQKVDPGAVFINADAKAPFWSDTLENQHLSISFWFARPDGQRFFITMDGMNPQGTAQFTQRDIDRLNPLSEVESQSIKHAARRVQLSPAQIVEKTWEEGKLVGMNGRKVDNPSLQLHLESIDKIPNTNPIWSIYYGGAKDGLTIWLDAFDGRILHRETSHFPD
jgi:hypothetical protein